MTKEEAVALLERYSNYDGMGIPNLAGCKEAMRVAVDALKEAYPELVESEDEKIRKWILEYLYDGLQKSDEQFKEQFKLAIAWLEKQKEQKVDIDKLRRDLYQSGYNDGYQHGKEDAQKEQKPAEPSGKPSRQEYLYHLLANGVITFSDYEFLMRNKGRKPADLSEMMVHKEPYIAPVPTPMTADEQKPEWSEEEKDKYTFSE